MKKLLFFVLLTLGLPMMTQAATYTVDTIEDQIGIGDCADESVDTECSLREAILAANDDSAENDTIILPAGEYILTLGNSGEEFASHGDLDIVNNGSVTIVGDSASTTIINGNENDRVFDVRAGASLSLSNVTVTGGSSTTAGGGIRANATSQLYLTDVAVTDNETTVNSMSGGGISFGGDTLRIENSLIDSNTSAEDGGGINISNGSTVIVNTTISNNTTDDQGGGVTGRCCGSFDIDIRFSTIANNSSANTETGGGIYYDSDYGTFTVFATILASNTEGGVENRNCKVPNDIITSAGYNIETGARCVFVTADGDVEETDPEFVDLADNGGQTQTYAIPTSSPAVDAVDSALCLDALSQAMTEDQRGLARPDNANCDIGAYELDQTSPVVSATDSSLECSVDSYTSTVTVSDNADDLYGTTLIATTNDSVDTSTTGVTTLIYSATDTDGNTGTGNHVVTVVDTNAPTISLVGSAVITITKGDAYAEPGVTTADLCDGDLSVTTVGTVNTNTAGTYTLTYTVMDGSGLTDSVTRIVTVQEAEESEPVDPDTPEEPVEEEPSEEEEDTVDEGDDTETEDPTDSEDSEDTEDTDESEAGEDSEEVTVTGVSAQSDNQFVVTYSDGTTRTITAFSSGSQKPRVKLSTDGERVVVMKRNGKVVRVFDALTGEQLTSKKIRTKGQSIAYLKVFEKNGHQYVAAATKKGKTIRTTLMRLTSEDQLKNTNTKRYTYNKANFRLQIKNNRIRIKTRRGKVKQVYSITNSFTLQAL